MNSGSAGRTPMHLWIVGVLSLVWNAVGAYDFLMINARNAAYLDRIGMPVAMMDLIDAFPLSVLWAWGIGVAGAVLGSLLLLMRSYSAAYAFAVSLLCLAVVTFYEYGLDLPEQMKTPAIIALDIAVWIVAVALLLYSIRMRTMRVLR